MLERIVADLLVGRGNDFERQPELAEDRAPLG
jgi:hypothetical protein